MCKVHLVQHMCRHVSYRLCSPCRATKLYPSGMVSCGCTRYPPQASITLISSYDCGECLAQEQVVEHEYAIQEIQDEINTLQHELEVGMAVEITPESTLKMDAAEQEIQTCRKRRDDAHAAWSNNVWRWRE